MTVLLFFIFWIFLDAGKDTTKNSEENPAVVKKQISIEPDDVLKIDCTDEVDEFTNFLNEFEDELKSPTSEGPKVDKVIDKKAGPKPPALWFIAYRYAPTFGCTFICIPTYLRDPFTKNR